MCLAVPMQIDRIHEDGSGTVSIDGASYHVDLSLIDNPTKGDYVIVHAGFAIEKLDQEEADQRIELFEELAEAHNRQLSDFR